MSRTLDVIESKVGKLNTALSTLNKNAAVLKAPADAKAYAALKTEMSALIKDGMECSKKFEAMMKKVEAAVK